MQDDKFNYQESKNVFLNTVHNNELIYSKRELINAKLVKDLISKLGYPSEANLKKMINNGSLINCPVTIKDVTNYYDIYGEPIASIKGKTVNKKPFIVNKHSEIRIDKNATTFDINVTITADIMYAFKFPYLVTVSEKLGLIMVVPLSNRQKNTIKNAVYAVINKYIEANFKIDMIKLDSEGGLQSIQNDIKNDYDIIVNVASKSQHVPLVERKIRQIKERMRCILSEIPYQLNKKLLDYLVFFAVKVINCTISSVNYNTVLTPFEIFTGRKVDLKRDFRINFGQFVQILLNNNFQNQINVPRTVDAIALISKDNLQGSYYFYVISTGKIVSRDHWIEIPINQDIINKLNEIAKKEKSEIVIVERLDDGENLDNNKIVEQDIDEFTAKAANIRITPTYDNNVYNDINVDEDDHVISNTAENIDENELNDKIIIQQADENLVIESNSNNENNDINDINDVIQEEIVDNNDDKNEIKVNQNEDDIFNDLQRDSLNVNENNTQSETIDETINSNENIIDNQRIIKYDLRPRLKKFDAKLGKFVGYTNIEQQIKSIGIKAEEAVENELKQLIEKKVFKPIHKDQIPKNIQTGKQNILLNKTFIKVKRDETVKGRTVLRGDLQNKKVYDILKDLSSATIKHESIMLILSNAINKNKIIVTADIVGAYLNADIKKDIYMKFNNYESKILCKLDKKLKEYLNKDDNCIYVKLLKALYGGVESAKLFFEFLQNILLNYGFKNNNYDQCVYHLVDENKKEMSIGIHVDDLIITSDDDNAIKKFLKYLKSKVFDIKIHQGNQHNYLGMNIKNCNDYLEIEMISTIKSIIDDWGITKKSKIPADEDFFQNSINSKLLDTQKKDKFHTFVARILYVARLARPDILGYISYLTTIVNKPSEGDEEKLKKLIGYLLFTLNLTYKISKHSRNKDNSIDINVYIDSSHGLHADMRGRTGIIIKLGKATIFARSIKQKYNSKSSAETELYGVSEEISQAIWTKYWLQDMGEKVNKINLFLDNKSTIIMILTGKCVGRNTRHIHIRNFFVKQFVDDGTIKLVYMPSEDLFVDLLTKAMQGEKLKRFTNHLMYE